MDVLVCLGTNSNVIFLTHLSALLWDVCCYTFGAAPPGMEYKRHAAYSCAQSITTTTFRKRTPLCVVCNPRTTRQRVSEQSRLYHLDGALNLPVRPPPWSVVFNQAARSQFATSRRSVVYYACTQRQTVHCVIEEKKKRR